VNEENLLQIVSAALTITETAKAKGALILNLDF
jgi:hypothetical protein